MPTKRPIGEPKTSVAPGLLNTLAQSLRKRELKSSRRRLTLAVPGAVDFSSNDFLSLSQSPELRQAYLTELRNATLVPLGSGGSRLLDGNSSYAEGIERDIASFYNAPAALLFNSGFDANSGLFSCLPQPGDAILYDEYIHASVHEGMRLSRATSHEPFRHNCVESFEYALNKMIGSDPSFLSGSKNVFVAVESVYSMDGDVAPIKEILNILEQVMPAGNGHLLVDEAHATGVYGSSGRGIVYDLGVEDRILARLHTFGKALSSGGAVVLCQPTLKDYLINYARTLIYTTALGLPTLALIRTVHGFMRSGGTRKAQQDLWVLVNYFQSRLHELPSSKLLYIVPGPAQSPIFSLFTSHPRSLAGHCQAAGFVVRPIVPPTVPEGARRVRVCLHSGNSTEEVDRLVQVIAQWLDSFSKEPVSPVDSAEVRSRL